MNYIVYAMISLTVAPIIFGTLLGLMRGSRRAFLRLILILLSVVLAFALYGTVANKLMETEISFNGESAKADELLKSLLMSNMSESLAEALADYALPIAQSLLQIVVFLLLFGAFWFLTWLIVFPLCKLFVKKGKKPHRLLGGIFGIVQGAVVALVVCVVFSGLIINTGNIVAAANDLQNISGSEQTQDPEQISEYEMEDPDAENPEQDTDPDSGNENEQPPEGEQPAEGSLFEMLGQFGEMIDDYADSKLGKFYTKIGSKAFDKISEVKTEEGKITLAGQVDAIRGLSKMAKELAKLQDIDFADLFKEGNIDNLKSIFDALGDITDELSDEAKKTIGNLVTAMGDELGVNLSGLDFTEIDFHKEGQIFSDLASYRDKDIEEITEQDVNNIIDNLVDSDIILDVLKENVNVDIGSHMDEDHVEKIEEKIDALKESGVEQDKIDALYKIFGITK